jgi:divalent metal cation (Fe/Co/Zn/Cd) transporter
VASVVRLTSGASADPTVAAIGLAGVSLVALVAIAAVKYRVARRVASRALRTDAHITVVGATTSLVTVLGLAFTEWGWGAADATAALVVAVAAGVVGVTELREVGD